MHSNALAELLGVAEEEVETVSSVTKLASANVVDAADLTAALFISVFKRRMKKTRARPARPPCPRARAGTRPAFFRSFRSFLVPFGSFARATHADEETKKEGEEQRR